MMRMGVDTGAAVSIISECTYRHCLHAVTLKKSRVFLRTYSAKPLVVLGESDGSETAYCFHITNLKCYNEWNYAQLEKEGSWG